MKKLTDFLLFPFQVLVGIIIFIGSIALYVLPLAIAIAIGLLIFNWIVG